MTRSSMEPYARDVLRIVTGFTFFCHGAQKLFGLFGGHKVSITSLVGVGGCLEAAGGALLILGLFTSCVAFVLSGEMAVAYFMAHFPKGFWPIQNGGELAVVYCFVFLYLFTAGSGPLSLDSLLFRKK